MTVIIGSKWAPGHRIVKDEVSGEYQEMNPRMNTSTDLIVQRALLRPLKWPSEVVAWHESINPANDPRNYPDTNEYQRDVLSEHASMAVRQYR